MIFLVRCHVDFRTLPFPLSPLKTLSRLVSQDLSSSDVFAQQLYVVPKATSVVLLHDILRGLGPWASLAASIFIFPHKM